MGTAPVTRVVLTEPQVHALARQVAERDGDARVVAVAAEPRWDGPDPVDTEHGSVWVAPCPSALAARAAVAGHAAHDGLLLLVTDRDERDLGEELLAGVWGRRLLSLRSWDAVRLLFRAPSLDPRLGSHRWLAEALVGAAPARGYLPAPNGFLTQDLAWTTLLRHALRLDPEPADVRTLVAWALQEGPEVRAGAIAEPHRAPLAQDMDRRLGPPAGRVVRLVLDGRAGEVGALGVVAELVWAAGDEPAAVAARVRLEDAGLSGLTAAAAQTWGRASRAVLGGLAPADPGRGEVLARAQALLVRAGGGGLAARSEVLTAGFEARLTAAGHALAAVVADRDEGTLGALEERVDDVGRHLAAAGERHRLEVLDGARRLARWLVRTPGRAAGGDVTSLARDYVADGSWVDAARALLDAGETVPPLAAAYGALGASADQRRAARDRTFAAAFARWSTAVPVGGALLPVEQVLRTVALPLAAQAPVLVLLVDGLGWAGAHALLDALAAGPWRRVQPEAGPLPPVVATVPTVTRCSRTSFFAGRALAGGQAEEQQGLQGVATGAVLFHKADLAVDEGRVAPAVHAAIADPARQLVAVVVNAVDDHLAKGTQLTLAPGLEALAPVRWLTQAAAEAGRVVVLASDHGHVLERGSRAVHTAAGGGERWRPAGTPGADEVRVEGPRVLLGGGRVVVPATEALRYTPERKHGYHGGLTPAEVLCALAVLAPRGRAVPGWQEAPTRPPAWWDEASTTAPNGPTATVSPTIDTAGALTLFDPVDASAPSWLPALLASDVLGEQRALAGRVRLDDDALGRLLVALVAAGGVLPDVAAAAALEVPAHRLRPALQAARNLLNVDQYEVLRATGGEVRLDLRALAEQFRVRVP